MFDSYREARRRTFEKLTALRLRVDDWLDRHEHGSPQLLDLAELEALHAEREGAVADLEAAEKRLIEALLERRKVKVAPSADKSLSDSASVERP